MLIYLLLILLPLLLMLVVSYRDLRHIGLLYILTFLVYFFVSAFRKYTVGSDTVVYVQIYKNILFMDGPHLTNLFSDRFEPGFNVLIDCKIKCNKKSP